MRLPIPPSGQDDVAKCLANESGILTGTTCLSNSRNTETDQKWLPPTRERILETLRGAQSRISADELARDLDVDGDNREIFDKRLAAMERDGQLLPNRKGMLLVASKLDFTAGRVQGHRDGFGFLVPDDGGPDVFLSTREMRKIMHGDRVLIKQNGLDKRGKPEGTIVEVTQRINRQLVGRFLNERGIAVVVPEDQRIKRDILIGPADTLKAKPGQVVMVEIIEQPSGYTEPLGKIVQILGEIDDSGMEIEIAVRKFEVPHIFSEAAMAEAAALPSQVRSADLKNRIDLRDVPLVTIDGEDARDFDDAVYCEPIISTGAKVKGANKSDTGKRGNLAAPAGWRVLVAIADVSHYVTSGSPIDDAAIERCTSVYFPRRVIPMLPEKLSNGLCSLNPQVDRLVMVCDMVVSVDGEVTAYQFFNAVMHSAARLTYDEVWGILSGRNAQAARKRENLLPQLGHLYDVFHAFAQARQRRGAIDFDTVETKIVADANGRIERIEPRTRNDAHRLIEECMLAANVCAADFIASNKQDTLFRVHEGPTPEKLGQLREFLKTLGLKLGSPSSAPSPADYAALSVAIRDRPDANLLQTMMLRSMQQAVYTPDNNGHFGLSYAAYAHFTSPIRRYPDLLTHRAIKGILSGQQYKPLPLEGRLDEQSLAAAAAAANRQSAKKKKAAALFDKTTAGKSSSNKTPSSKLPQATPAQKRQSATHEQWQQYGMLCSVNERRADEASRDVESWLKCQYMRNRVGEEFVGRITGVTTFGLFVTLDELYVEGLVHISELGGDYYQYNELVHELRGERTGIRYRLTDAIVVQVARVDLEARRIEFKLVDRPIGSKGAAKQSAAAIIAKATGKLLPPSTAVVKRGTTSHTQNAKPAKSRKGAGKAKTAGAKVVSKAVGTKAAGVKAPGRKGRRR